MPEINNKSTIIIIIFSYASNESCMHACMHIKESNANICNGKMIFQCKSMKMHVTMNNNYRSFFKLTF